MSGIGSIWHWIIVALVVLVLFGRGRIAETMGDFGKGIRSFRKGLAEEEQTPPPAALAAQPRPVEPAAAPAPRPEADHGG